MADSSVNDLLVILGAGLLAAVICRKLRLSVLIGYLLVGILIADGLLGQLSEGRRDIEHLAEGNAAFGRDFASRVRCAEAFHRWRSYSSGWLLFAEPDGRGASGSNSDHHPRKSHASRSIILGGAIFVSDLPVSGN
ncbi:MAG: hypothetical protein RIK87_23435 [Fuerstiella sp.]